MLQMPLNGLELSVIASKQYISHLNQLLAQLGLELRASRISKSISHSYAMLQKQITLPPDYHNILHTLSESGSAPILLLILLLG